MRKLVLFSCCLIVAVTCVMLAEPVLAYADSAQELLAQSDTSSSTPRFRARSIKGLIYLAIAVISGIGWLIKKMIGGGDD